MYAKGPVVIAHTYPYQYNGHGFKGAIPRMTRLPYGGGGGDAAVLALHQMTPDSNTEQQPVPGVWWGYGVRGGGVSASTLSE